MGALASRRRLAVVILASFLAVSCAGSPRSKGTIEIGSDDATSDSDGLIGRPIQVAEAYAIARAGSVRGFSLKFVAYDDSVNGKHDATRGVQNVQEMTADPRLLGFIGPFDVGATAAELPVANAYSLAMISPDVTENCLTLSLSTCANWWAFTPRLLRPTTINNFFRIAAPDIFSGPAMAHFAFDDLGLRTIAVWDDQLVDGVLAADTFTAEFVRKGGKVVVRRGFDMSGADPPDFRRWLAQAKAAGAQGIYAGAPAWDGCLPRGQSVGIFDSTSYYLGPGDAEGTVKNFGIANSECIRDSGAMANSHMYAVVGIGEPALNRAAAAIVADYERAHPGPDRINRGTFAGYDCANILIAAIGRAIDANGGAMPTRQQVIDQLAATKDFRGLTGNYSFNTSGDPTRPTLQILQLTGEEWTAITNLTIGGE